MITLALVAAVAAIFWFVVVGIRSSSLTNRYKELFTILAAVVAIIAVVLIAFR